MTSTTSISNPTSKPRIDYLDFLKAIAILLVVSCHMSNTPSSIYNLSVSIQMPIFFFVSGLLAKGINFKRNDTSSLKKTLKFVIAKAHRLLLPYFVYITLQCILPHLSHIEASIMAFRTSIESQGITILWQPYCNLMTTFWQCGGWFLVCLFLVFVIHAVISWLTFLSGKNWMEYVLYVIAYVILRYIYLYHPIADEYYNLFCIAHLSWYLPYFFLGTKIKILEEWLSKNKEIVIAAICLITFAISMFKEGRGNINLSFHIYAITGIIGLYYFAKNTYHLFNSKIRAVFNYIGQRTLEIYLIHFFLLRYFHTLYVTDLIVIVALSLVICAALRYNKWVSCIVLGTKLPAGRKQAQQPEGGQ